MKREHIVMLALKNAHQQLENAIKISTLSTPKVLTGEEVYEICETRGKLKNIIDIRDKDTAK